MRLNRLDPRCRIPPAAALIGFCNGPSLGTRAARGTGALDEQHTPGAKADAVAARFAARSDRLIVGLATGYRFDALEPFLTSLADTGYDGSVVLYVGGMQPGCLAALTALGVEARPAMAFLSAEIDPQLARYAMYLDCLAGWPRMLRFAMVTDIRDVVFQSDPADFVALNQARGPSMHTWLESDGTDLLAEPNNRLWLHTLHGVATARFLTGQPISCSGISMGNHVGMLGYLARMQEEVRRQRGGLRLKGIDQGIHNSLVWGGRPQGSQIHQNGEHVLTLGIASGESFRIDSDQVVLPDGRVPAVLHQWDRHPALKALVRRRFPATTPAQAASFAAAPAGPAGEVLGWVGAEAAPYELARFLATARDAAPHLPIRLIGPGLVAPAMTAAAARFAAACEAPADGPDFHHAVLAALNGKPNWWPVLCLDTAKSLILDDPFRTRLNRATLLAMEGSGLSIDQYDIWRKALAALLDPVAAKAIGRKVPAAPHFLLGRVGGVRNLLGRFRRLRRAHQAAEAFALFQVAAFGQDPPTVELMPNFSLVANLAGFGDATVAVGAGLQFPDRSCPVVLSPERSSRVTGWADAIAQRMGADQGQYSRRSGG